MIILNINHMFWSPIVDTDHFSWILFCTPHLKIRLKSDLALYKVWHIAAKLSHETNLAITKLSLSLIRNTIGLGLPMFINATTRQQISIYSIGPYWYLLAWLAPTFGKVGGRKIFFHSLCSQILFCTPTLKSATLPLDTLMSQKNGLKCCAKFVQNSQKNGAHNLQIMHAEFAFFGAEFWHP